MKLLQQIKENLVLANPYSTKLSLLHIKPAIDNLRTNKIIGYIQMISCTGSERRVLEWLNTVSEIERGIGETQNYVLAEFDKRNENFCIYYKSQGIVKDDEWDAFIAALKDDLPTSFRIQGSSKYFSFLVRFSTHLTVSHTKHKRLR
ncbi:unnamed protein product [Brugia timori]|uniref:BLUF domain-containing protein n=1 Tax=Brugia timori TaxID=42155 RepID=A0A0R3QRR6_9BILA|nr:unnamed protein product [Brugia timori]